MATQNYTFQNGDVYPLLPLYYVPSEWSLKHPKKILKAESRSQRISTRGVGGGRIEGTFTFPPMLPDETRHLVAFLREMEGGHKVFALRIPELHRGPDFADTNGMYEGEYYNLNRTTGQGDNQLVFVSTYSGDTGSYGSLVTTLPNANGEIRFLHDGASGTGTSLVSRFNDDLPDADRVTHVEMFSTDSDAVDKSSLLSTMYNSRQFVYKQHVGTREPVVITATINGSPIVITGGYSLPIHNFFVYNPSDISNLDTTPAQTDQEVWFGTSYEMQPEPRTAGNTVPNANRNAYPPTLKCSLSGPVQQIKYANDNIVRIEIDVVERW